MNKKSYITFRASSVFMYVDSSVLAGFSPTFMYVRSSPSSAPCPL